MNAPVSDRTIYAFGPFHLDPVARLLLRDGARVSLTPRLFDTLLYLVENAGRVVEHEELLRVVWGGRVVDDANIKQTIFSLRKVLQAGNGPDRLIVTAPSRGYQFAAAIQRQALPPASARQAARPGRIFPRLAVAGLAASAVILFAWRAVSPRPTAPPFAPPPHSVAVLAFTNLSADPLQTYFSDGIADELTSTLGRIADLRVAGRTSAFSFRNQPATIRDIGRQLNVASVLEGSVRRSGSQVRITADLVDAATGFTLWTHAYDAPQGDILQVQGEVAVAVAGALRVTLLGSDAPKLIAGGTANPAAFDAYLHGVEAAETAASLASLRAALPGFDRAIALDPAFAMARVSRSHALLVLANSGSFPDVSSTQTTLAEVLAEARRAIALAPNLGEAHGVLGAALMSVQDFAGADREFTLAHALAPGNPQLTMDFALAQIQFGRVAAGLDAAQSASRQDPLTPGTYLYLASALLAAKRFDEARTALRRCKILGEGPAASVVERAIALQSGDYESVIRISEKGSAWPDIVGLAIAFHATGRIADAAAQLDRLHTVLGDSGALQYAEIHAQWGQTKKAVHWLQAAYSFHDPGLIMVRSDALLDPIRMSPDYADVERKLGYPQ